MPKGLSLKIPSEGNLEVRHRLSGREFEQTPGDGEGQGSQACCSPWGRK